MIKRVLWWTIVTGLMLWVRIKCSIAGAIVGWQLWNSEMVRQARLNELIK
jgi:hypothetical protein